MQAIERATIPSRLRLLEVDEGAWPDLGPSDWARLARQGREHPGLSERWTSKNMALDLGLETLARLLAGDLQAWNDGRWYRQALGAGAAAVAGGNLGLAGELWRGSFTEFSRSGAIVSSQTYVGASALAPLATTVSASPAPAAGVFTVASATGLLVGDLVRVALVTGYEWGTVAALAGAQVTLATPLSTAPLAGATVDQAIEEAAVFGALPASPAASAGTIALTNGSTAVTGTGTAWLGKLAAGEQLRLATSRAWLDVASVGGNGSLTLAAPYAGATVSGQTYFFRGLAFNRVTGLRYIKPPTKGFLFETSWTLARP